MILVLEVAAFLAAGAVVATVWSRSASFSAIATALAPMAVAFGYIVFASHVWQTSSAFADQRRQWVKLTPAQQELAGAPTPADPFVEWIRGRIRPGETFYIVPSPNVDEAVRQWFTYRLLPHFETDRPQDADLLIFYFTTPKQSGLSRLVAGPVEKLDNDSLIARTRNAD
jgi:hypothetical protein